VTDVDVVVIGAGPAGSVTARLLAGRGHSVVVLERRPGHRSGTRETLGPAVQPLLRRLGLWPRFTELGPIPSWGTRSVWSGPEPDDASHPACGWHLDRAGFDAMLATAAAEAGADVRTGATVRSAGHRDGHWTVDGDRPVTARVLIDATGRRATAGRLLGARREPLDRLVALIGSGPAGPAARLFLQVEAVPDGWWYTAPAPGDTMVAMLVTDVDLCRRHGPVAGWADRLRTAPWTAARLAGPPGPARIRPAASHRLRRTGDPRPWLAAGDAALAVDPISGTGVLRALSHAGAAAETAERLLAGDPSALAGYEADRDREFARYRLERTAHYAAANRLDSPFWERRAADYPRPDG
jgi:flavin-dependent dehydrogenase